MNLVKKLASVQEVKEVHDISTIYVGGKLYITLHAYVNPELSVEEAHKIAESIETRMHSDIKSLENVTVHVEPAGVAIPATEVTEAQIRTIVNDVAKGIAFNLRIKRVVTYDAQRQTLHQY